MASNDEILERLDKLVAIQQLVHREALESARVSIRADKVNAAILDTTTKLTPAGKVVADVKKKTGQSPATISRRIASLMELGAVEKQGGGPATHYRSTGLI
jgi:Fic family protein